MVRRQFIAGARCPACNAEDRIRLCREADAEWLECVDCGYQSAEPPAAEHPPEPEAETTSSVKWMTPPG